MRGLSPDPISRRRVVDIFSALAYVAESIRDFCIQPAFSLCYQPIFAMPSQSDEGCAPAGHPSRRERYPKRRFRNAVNDAGHADIDSKTEKRILD